MGIPRLAAAVAVCGAATLAMATPAAAAAKPQISAVPAMQFSPGGSLKLKVTGCEDTPRIGLLPDDNKIFFENPEFTEDGPAWTAIGDTKTTLKPGQTYRTIFACKVGNDRVRFPLDFKVPQPPKEQPPADFEFGFDKVDLSTRTVTPNGKMTFTVTCPTSVTAESVSFTKAPTFEKSAKDTFKGQATFKATLPSIVTIKVTCKDFGSVTYSTEPGKGNIGNGGPKIPKGAPNTGDGSTAGGDGDLALGGGAALALAGAAGLGAVALRRRSAKAARENA